MQTLTYSSHVAHVDPMTGSGLFVMPNPDLDVVLDGVSLHATDRTHALADLERRGFVLSDEGDGLPVLDGYTEDGREVFGLYGLHSITTSPSLEEIAQAYAGLVALAGLTT